MDSVNLTLSTTVKYTVQLVNNDHRLEFLFADKHHLVAHALLYGLRTQSLPPAVGTNGRNAAVETGETSGKSPTARVTFLETSTDGEL